MWPRRSQNKVTVPSIDPAAGDPAGAALIASLRGRDWRAAHDFLSTVGDPDDLGFYLGLAATTPGLQAWIHEWIDAAPRSNLPVLVRGVHAVDWAWQARGAARADSTSAARFRMFAQRLRLADDCLREAAARDPGDPNAWASLIITGVGQGLGVAEATRRFNEATARYRWHGPAHDGLFMQLCAKWGGSHEQMHQFAGTTAAAAPPGSPLGVLAAEAHLERWLDLPDGDDRAYLRRPEVMADLFATADRTVRHPAYRRRPGWPAAHNTFAMLFWLADQHDAAADQFDEVGDLVTRQPWQYLSSSYAERFATARADAYSRRTTAPRDGSGPFPDRRRA